VLVSHPERVLIVGAVVVLAISWGLYLWVTTVFGFDLSAFESELASTLVLVVGVVVVILAARLLKSRRASAPELPSASAGMAP